MNQADAAERIESLKSGIVAAVAAGVTFSLFRLTFGGIIQYLRAGSLPLDHFLVGREFFRGAIVLLSGFLFGVTYRYIVRGEVNLQLKLGAVMAFGLVRGMAQAEIGMTQQVPLWIYGFWIGESILLFAMAATALDYAIGRSWVQSFGIDNPTQDRGSREYAGSKKPGI